MFIVTAYKKHIKTSVLYICSGKVWHVDNKKFNLQQKNAERIAKQKKQQGQKKSANAALVFKCTVCMVRIFIQVFLFTYCVIRLEIDVKNL